MFVSACVHVCPAAPFEVKVWNEREAEAQLLMERQGREKESETFKPPDCETARQEYAADPTSASQPHAFSLSPSSPAIFFSPQILDASHFHLSKLLFPLLIQSHVSLFSYGLFCNFRFPYNFLCHALICFSFLSHFFCLRPFIKKTIYSSSWLAYNHPFLYG